MHDTLVALQSIIRSRIGADPKESYTASLYAGGVPLQKRKIGEEAVEVITAVDNKEIINETADLIFHLIVYLETIGISVEDIAEELKRRMK